METGLNNKVSSSPDGTQRLFQRHVGTVIHPDRHVGNAYFACMDAFDLWCLC